MSLHVSHHFIISCSPDKDWLPFYQPRVQRAEQSFSEKPCWVHDPLLPTHSGQIQLLGCQHNSERASVVEPLVLFLVNRQEGVGRVKRRKKDDGNWFAFDSVFSATSLAHTHTQTADYRVTAPANTVHAVPVKSRGCVIWIVVSTLARHLHSAFVLKMNLNAFAFFLFWFNSMFVLSVQ